jgi:hypothetical protein
MPETPRDSRVTVVALAAIACVVQDVLHEGLGHGVTAWLSGAHRLTMSTVALQSDIDTRLVLPVSSRYTGANENYVPVVLTSSFDSIARLPI